MIVRPQKFSCKVIKKTKLTNKVFWLTFKLVNPLEINFQAGQRCLFDVFSKRNNYSLCSSPSQKTLVETCVDTTPNGPGSRWITLLKEGDSVNFLGPLGNFVLSNLPSGSKIFIATGTGISPIRSMILDLLEKKYKDQIYLYFGERFVEDIFWREEFEKLQKENPNFHYIITLSKPSPAWQGRSGYVQTAMEEDLLIKSKNNPLDYEFYLCGNGKMVSNTTDLLIKYGIRNEKVITERFYEVTKDPNNV